MSYGRYPRRATTFVSGGGPLYDLILNYYDREGPTMCGWFATEEDWNNGIILLTDRLPNQFHARVHRRSSSDSLALAPAAFTSWQTVGFSIHTSGIRWPFGLSVALDVVFGASGDGTIAHRVFQARTNPVHDAYSGPPSKDGHFHQAAEAARAAAGTVRISGYVGRFRR